LAQPLDPEATDTALRDEQDVAFDPIERYLKILNPKQEAPFTEGDPVQMAIATALLLGVQELKRIADAVEGADDSLLKLRFAAETLAERGE
jgi:hypothetical protein